MLSVTGLESGYKRTMIVHDFSLEVGEGEIIGLLGRNGVGKTTVLKTLMGLLPVNAGSISLDGQDIGAMKAHNRARQGIAYVPQGRQIFSSLSVRDNIRVAAYGAGIKNWESSLQEMFAEFPILKEKQNQPGGQLSGGQQQILALARALITKPRFILLDEPSEGIQPSIVQQIGEVILKLSQERKISVILVEQNFDFAASVVSTMHLMQRGTIVYAGPPETIRDDVEMQHQFLGL